MAVRSDSLSTRNPGERSEARGGAGEGGGGEG